jgi:hypothetical protein
MMAAAAMMAATSTNQGLALTVGDDPNGFGPGFAGPRPSYRAPSPSRFSRKARTPKGGNPAGTKLLKKAAKGHIGIR